jgi:hypothetical protein
METSINILDEHNEHGEYDENEIINYIKNYYPDYVLEAANKYLNKNLKPSEILYCAKVDSGYQDKIKTIREKHRKNFQLKLAKIKAMD